MGTRPGQQVIRNTRGRSTWIIQSFYTLLKADCEVIEHAVIERRHETASAPTLVAVDPKVQE
jgi:hypothetical protein